MPATSPRPAADPFDDIDRLSGGVDTLMERQDRADLPGERSDQPRAADGDIYIDAAREVSLDSIDPNQEALDADREADLAAGRVDVEDGDLDIELLPQRGQGLDDDEPIEETERAGDDSFR